MTTLLDPRATATFPAPAQRSRPSDLHTHALPHAVTEPITMSSAPGRIGRTSLVGAAALVVGLGVLGSVAFSSTDPAPLPAVPEATAVATGSPWCGDDTATGTVTLRGAGYQLPVHVEVSTSHACDGMRAPRSLVSVGRDS